MNSSTSGWLVLTRNFVAGSHPQNDTVSKNKTVTPETSHQSVEIKATVKDTSAISRVGANSMVQPMSSRHRRCLDFLHYPPEKFIHAVHHRVIQSVFVEAPIYPIVAII